MSQRIRGVLAPVVTPFKSDLPPDSQRFIAHCKWLLSQNCGLAEFGTNSESELAAIKLPCYRPGRCRFVSGSSSATRVPSATVVVHCDPVFGRRYAIEPPSLPALSLLSSSLFLDRSLAPCVCQLP